MRSRSGPGPRLLLILSGGESGGGLLAWLLSRYRPVRVGPEPALFHHEALLDPGTYPAALYRGLTGRGDVPTSLLRGRLAYPLAPPGLIFNRPYYGCEDADDQLRLLRSTENVHDLVAALVGHCTAAHGWEPDAVLCEHTPSSSLWAERVVRAFAGRVAVVHVVRDARDAIASLAVRRRYGRLTSVTLEEAVRLSAEEWCLLNTSALQAENAGAPYVRVRFEDLLLHPGDVVSSVADQVLPDGAELRPDAPPRLRTEAPAEAEWLDDPRGDETPRAIGRYRKVLPRVLSDRMLELEFGSQHGLEILSPRALQRAFGYEEDAPGDEAECLAALED